VQNNHQAFVIGDPVSHSLSPKLHQFWLKKYNISGSYKAVNISANELPSFFQKLQTGEFIGGNVTIPHKENIFSLCDEISQEVKEIGAINTLVLKDNKVFGANSDWIGFLENLDREALNWDKNAEQKHAIILGAGGASRAIIYALMRRKFSHIHILNRTKDRAISLSKQMKLVSYEEVKIRAHSLDEFNNLAPKADLVVNTSSIGMNDTKFENLALDNLPKSAIINDIVYTPLNTPLLIDAKNIRLKTVDGLGMLLFQAAFGFEKWFGVKPEIDNDLRNHLLSALGEKPC